MDLVECYYLEMNVGIHEAKTTLSALLRRVAQGEEVVITKSGQPIARLVPISSGRTRKFGFDLGRMVVPDDFDAPLDDETLAAFEQ